MCDEREKLIGYLYDECDAGEKQLVEAHLETCETCRGEIAGLRSVRTDLLAWDVPNHGSVWTPFVKTRPAPWYREVPAWALAAAASVMFVVGAGGGAATQAWMQRGTQAPAAVQAAAPLVASVTAADLAALEQRLRTTFRSEISAVDGRVQLASAHTTPARPSDDAELLRRIAALIDQSEQRQLEGLTAVNAEFVKAKIGLSSDIENLRLKVESLTAPGR